MDIVIGARGDSEVSIYAHVLDISGNEIDVYKRQEPPEERETLPGMRQGKQLSGNYLYRRSHVAAGTYSACPVSYTHLDVYKRQG